MLVKRINHLFLSEDTWKNQMSNVHPIFFFILWQITNKTTLAVTSNIYEWSYIFSPLFHSAYTNYTSVVHSVQNLLAET